MGQMAGEDFSKAREPSFLEKGEEKLEKGEEKHETREDRCADEKQEGMDAPLDEI